MTDRECCKAGCPKRPIRDSLESRVPCGDETSQQKFRKVYESNGQETASRYNDFLFATRKEESKEECKIIGFRMTENESDTTYFGFVVFFHIISTD